MLSYKDYAFSFEFSALHYSMPEKNQYAYMMERFDKDWTYTGTRRFATYTNLEPGSYVFRVKGSNNPLYIIGNTNDDREWQGNVIPFKKNKAGAEIKANRQPVGIYGGEQNRSLITALNCKKAIPSICFPMGLPISLEGVYRKMKILKKVTK